MSSERMPVGPVVWGRVCDALRPRIGERNFATWVAPLRSRWTDGTLALDAPDRTTLDRVTRHFLGLIEDALAEAAGRAYPVRLGLSPSPASLPLPIRPPTGEHTFESFVTGESNRRACDAARALVEDAGAGPLLLHGPSGVGKTHLLHAIFHALDAATRVACLSAAELVSLLLEAYAAGADARFWSDLQPLGALLLDDVHSITALEETQQRLIEGLAGWVRAGRLLVLTSDRPPEEMSGLVARLADRFPHRMVAGIDPPDAALRRAILDRKALAHGITLDRRLVARLAAAVSDNVRTLEGMLTRLIAFARLSDRVVDESLALEVLPELTCRPPDPPTLDHVLRLTAEAFGLPRRRLSGRGRDADTLLARRVAMYLAREVLGQSLAQIGRAFGRNHTTVLHSVHSVARTMERDAGLAETVGRLERQLGGGTGT